MKVTNSIIVTEPHELSFDSTVADTKLHIDVLATRKENFWDVVVELLGSCIRDGHQHVEFHLGAVSRVVKVGLVDKLYLRPTEMSVNISDYTSEDANITAETVKHIGENIFCEFRCQGDSMCFYLEDGVTADLRKIE